MPLSYIPSPSINGFHLGPLFIHFLIQALDGGQGDATFVHGRDVFVVRTNAKGGVEVLCHGSDVLHGTLITSVAPALDWSAH